MQKKELGDFQTPEVLAELMTGIIKAKNAAIEVIVEPTCGKGSILLSAHKMLQPRKSFGIEIQKKYADELAEKNMSVLNADFFDSVPAIKNAVGDYERILFIGNPPWVTNAALSPLNSNNLPKKSNIDNMRGIEAITGKSNFDIAESVIQTLIDEFSSKKSVFAFLCKISVAKKIMARLWRHTFKYKTAELYPIDSKKYFSAAVDACFFYLDCSEKTENTELAVFESVEKPVKKYASGFFKSVYFENLSLKSSIAVYGKSPFVWRNGVKHDCAKVMELRMVNGELKNGYGETVDIEDDLVFPFLKSSDLTKVNRADDKKILITQHFINEPTDSIRIKYPKTWLYLTAHAHDFEKRKSVIYKNKCPYAIFSVGEYTFKPYKIAISGLYKSLAYKIIAPFEDKSVLLDDTCNFISFDTMDEAAFVFSLLQTQAAKDYLFARVSWESKRPIKTEILNTLDVKKLAAIEHKECFYSLLFEKNDTQKLLFA